MRLRFLVSLPRVTRSSLSFPPVQSPTRSYPSRTSYVQTARSVESKRASWEGKKLLVVELAVAAVAEGVEVAGSVGVAGVGSWIGIGSVGVDNWVDQNKVDYCTEVDLLQSLIGD